MGAIHAHHGLLLGGIAGPWTPAQLGTPAKFWLNDDSNIVNNAGACSQWDDISGNGFNFTQNFNASFRPLIVASGLNSRRTIRFDGSDDYMQSGVAGASDVLKNTGAGWALFVAKKTALDGGATDRHLFMMATNASGTTRFLASHGSGSAANKPRLAVRRLDADSAATLLGTSAVDTNFHILLMTMDWAAGDGTTYIDGAQDTQNLSLTTSGSTSNTASADAPTIGAASNGSAAFANSEIAEFIVGAGALPSAGEIDKLFGYTAHRWGLTSLLPGGHPYKTTPP